MPHPFANIEDSNVPVQLSTHIGDAVNIARQRAGYSIEQLAVTCGLTEIEIAKVEAGREADERLVRRIARALKLAPATLLDSRAA
jgi:transcriptional regulator with XRE-family HTH domain